MRREREDESLCEGLRQHLKAIAESEQSNPCETYRVTMAYLHCLEDCNQPGLRHKIEEVWRKSVFYGYGCQQFKVNANTQQSDTSCYKEPRVSNR